MKCPYLKNTTKQRISLRITVTQEQFQDCYKTACPLYTYSETSGNEWCERAENEKR